MKVQNKGGKGNPNHDDNTGKFTEENGGSQQVEELETDSLSFKLEFDVNNIDDFIGSIDFMSKQEKDNEADSFISGLGSLDNIATYDNTSLEDKKLLLEFSSFEYDKTKLSELTDKQIEALNVAESICFAPKVAEQEVLLAEKAREDLLNKQENELQLKSEEMFGSSTGPSISGVWFSSVSANDFDSKNIPDENGKTAIDRKKEYFEDVIQMYSEIANDPLSFESDIEHAQNMISDATQKIDNLNKWVEDCQKYKELKTQIQQQYINQIENAEKEINDAQKRRDYFKTEDFLFKLKLSKDFIGKFQDKNAAYSQFRKDNAVWFKGMSSYDTAQKAKAHFGPKFQSKWASMSLEERQSLIGYTGAFSRINEPLRGIMYTGGNNISKIPKDIYEMTNAINKCTWDEDIWVQRGVSIGTQMFNIGGKKVSISYFGDDLSQLVGATFKDNGFYSAGAGKGTGFDDNGLIINTYCPKGTKMAYMNTKGHYANTTENEMILQRGYSYRITKVEKKGYKYYMDVEVILDSDDGNDNDLAKLKQIGEKYT